MSKEMTVILLGLLVAITPYLGIPGSWKTVLLVLSGLGIAAAGFLLRGESIGRMPGSKTDAHGFSNTFVENFTSRSSRDTRDHGIGSLN